MKLPKRFHPGFTIVELLVVIVVIGLLAGIVTIAYNGISQQSENQKTIAAINQTVKLLQLYKQQNNGNYPSYTASYYVCIGTGYQNGICVNETATGNGITGREDTTFNAALKTVGGLPQPSTKIFTRSNGLIAAGANFDSVGRAIRWRLQGENQNCGIAGAFGSNDNGSTGCYLALQ
jgi:prepilin-type N-terminal cleavage/methylation domain-containing protein